MVEVKQSWVGKEYEFWHVEKTLRDAGFIRGSMWDWDYAAYDYALETSKISEYVYLRINIDTVQGRIEDPFAIVKIRDIWITGAKYHQGLNQEMEIKKSTQEKAEQIIKRVATQFADEDLGEYIGWTVLEVTVNKNRKKVLKMGKDGEVKTVQV